MNHQKYLKNILCPFLRGTSIKYGSDFEYSFSVTEKQKCASNSYFTIKEYLEIISTLYA